MKSKKIISGLLALAFVFGGAVLPNATVSNVAVTANAEGMLPSSPPPQKETIIVKFKAEFSEEHHQIRLRWKPVENAEKYGVAVYYANLVKWKIQTQNIPADVASYTSPKDLTPGTTYKVVVAVKVNGKWNASDAVKNAVSVTVK